jgi:hypothetical protein
LDTSKLVEFIFAAHPYSEKVLSNYFKVVNDRFIIKSIILLNTCKQLKSLRFQYLQLNNEIIASIDPVLLKQLTTLEWSSCRNPYNKLHTMDIVRTHCFNLTTLILCCIERSTGTEQIKEYDIISLVKQNKQLQTIRLLFITATDALLETVYKYCSNIKHLTIYTNDEYAKCILSLQMINKFMLKSLKCHSILLIINGCKFGHHPADNDTITKRFYFKSLFVSKKVFQDLILLSESPVLKRVVFDDCLLYHEDQFVMCVNNWSILRLSADVNEM